MASHSENKTTLDDKTKDLTDDVEDLDQTTKDFTDGIDKLDTDTKDLADDVEGLDKTTKDFTDGIDKLDTDTKDLADDVEGLDKTTKDFTDGIDKLDTDTKDLADGVEGLDKTTEGLTSSPEASKTKIGTDGLSPKLEIHLPKVTVPTVPATDYLNLSSLFKSAPPTSNYVFETDLKFLDIDKMKGSLYFLDRIGYNPDQDIRVAFDPFMESRIIMNQVQEQTRKRYIDRSAGSDWGQLERLYEHTYDEYRRLYKEEGIRISPGVALTEKQVAALKKPIVWLEAQNIALSDGSTKKVLMPKFYSPNTNKNQIDKSVALIGGGVVDLEVEGDLENDGSFFAEMHLDLKSKNGSILNNKTGSLFSDGTMSLKGKKDFLNKGHIKSADDLSIDFERDIFNEASLSSTAGSVFATAGGSIFNNGSMFAQQHLGLESKEGSIFNNKTGSLFSDGTMSLKGKKDMINRGGKIKSGSHMVMDFGGDIRNENVKKRLGSTASGNYKDVLVSKGIFESGGGMSLKAGHDISFIGTGAKSGGGMILDAGHKINLLSEAYESATRTESTKTTGGWFNKKTETTVSTTKKTTQMGAFLDSGGDLSMTSGFDINIIGSQVGAKGNGVIKSKKGDINVKNAVNSKESHSKTEGSDWFSSSSQEDYDYEETAVESGLNFGGGLALETDDHNDVILEGVSMSTGGDLSVKTRDFKIKAAELRNESWSKSSGSGFFKNGGLYGSSERRSSKDSIGLHSSNIKVGNNMLVKAVGDMSVEASNMGVEGLADIDVKNFIVTSKAEILETSHYEKKTKLGGISLKTENGALSMGVTGSGTEHLSKTKTSTQKQSNIGFGSLNLKTKENAVITSSNVDVFGDSMTDIGGDFLLLDAHNTTDTYTEDKQLDIEIGIKVDNAYVNLGLATKALADAKNVLEHAISDEKRISKLHDEGKASEKALILARTKVALATTAVASATTALVKATATAAQSAGNAAMGGTGINVSVYEKTSYSSSIRHSKNAVSKGSRFKVMGNSKNKVGGKFKMRGSEMYSEEGDMSMDAGEIELLAGVSTSSTDTKTKSGSQTASLGLTAPGGGVSVSGSYNQSEESEERKTHKNSYFGSKKGKMDFRSRGDVKLKGARVEGDKMSTSIGGDLLMETVQDTYTKTGSSFGLNASFTTKDKSGNASKLSSVGGSMGLTDIEERTTVEKTGFVEHSTHDEGLSDAENLDQLLSSDAFDVAGATTNKTEKEDYAMTDADFEGNFSVPLDLLTKKGREGIKDAYKDFGKNLRTIVTEGIIGDAIEITHEGIKATANGIKQTIAHFEKRPEEVVNYQKIEDLDMTDLRYMMACSDCDLKDFGLGVDKPIRFIDPDGRMAVDVMPPDDYKVDEQGNISLLRKTDDNFDVLYNNDESKSIQVDKGVLNNSRTNTVTGSNDKEYTFDQYDVTGDGKAKGLFEFVSDNSNVEWSLTGIGAKSGEKGKNILSTSHIKDSEIGGGYLKAYGYTIRKHSHSHPYNSFPSTSDKGFAKSLNLKFPKATLDIYHKGEYFKYNESGLISIPTITLPEIEIKAPKND